MTRVTSCPPRLTGCRTQQLGIISPRTASTLGRGRDSSNTDCIASTDRPAWGRQRKRKKALIKQAAQPFDQPKDNCTLTLITNIWHSVFHTHCLWVSLIFAQCCFWEHELTVDEELVVLFIIDLNYKRLHRPKGKCNFSPSHHSVILWTTMVQLFREPYKRATGSNQQSSWMILQLFLPVWTRCWCSRSPAAGWGGRRTGPLICKLNRNA